MKAIKFALTRVALFLISVVVLQKTASDQDLPNRIFGLHTYKATAGKLDKALARFRHHTKRMFEKHGMANLGIEFGLKLQDHPIRWLACSPMKAKKLPINLERSSLPIQSGKR